MYDRCGELRVIFHSECSVDKVPPTETWLMENPKSKKGKTEAAVLFDWQRSVESVAQQQESSQRQQSAKWTKHVSNERVLNEEHKYGVILYFYVRYPLLQLPFH